MTTTTMRLPFEENRTSQLVSTLTTPEPQSPLGWYAEEDRAEWQQYWRNIHPDSFGFYLHAFEKLEAEFDADSGAFVKKITSGASVQRNEKCGGHGVFTRPGFRYGNWIAWAGCPNPYGSSWHDAGCDGCRLQREEWRREAPTKQFNLPIREFHLKAPVACATHGNFLVSVNLTEYAEEFAKIMGYRYRLQFTDHNTGCPGCDGDMIWEWNVQTALEDLLPKGGWEVVGERILSLIDEAHAMTEKRN